MARDVADPAVAPGATAQAQMAPGATVLAAAVARAARDRDLIADRAAMLPVAAAAKHQHREKDGPCRAHRGKAETRAAKSAAIAAIASASRHANGPRSRSCRAARR